MSKGMFNNDFPTIFQRTCISADEAPGSKRLERNSNHKTTLLFIIFCGSVLYCIDTVTYCSTLTVRLAVNITSFMVPQLNIEIIQLSFMFKTGKKKLIKKKKKRNCNFIAIQMFFKEGMRRWEERVVIVNLIISLIVTEPIGHRPW